MLKNVIAKEKYKSYSEELKKAIDKRFSLFFKNKICDNIYFCRYVESKVPERNKC